MQLYKRLRREYEHGLGSIRGVAQKYKVHRRTVRAALKNSVPPRRKVTPRERPKMILASPFIDGILEKDFKAPFNERHTAHQIWGRMQTEMPACDIGESTVRAYVRIRKAELDVAEQQPSSQAAAARMMQVLHSDAALRVIEKELPSGAASRLVGFIKGGRFRERKKALAVLGRLRGIRTAVIARCLKMSRRRSADTSAALQTTASMHSCRRRRPSRTMIRSEISSCFRYFTRLRPLTGLTEPPGGWMIFTELCLRVVTAHRENVYVPSSRRPDSNGRRQRLY